MKQKKEKYKVPLIEQKEHNEFFSFEHIFHVLVGLIQKSISNEKPEYLEVNHFNRNFKEVK
jgi:hypothetical protein